jgi:hypothetical protein
MNKVVKHSQNPVWLMNGRNYLLEGDGFYISYNPDTSGGHLLTDFANMLGGNLTDGEETALVQQTKERNIYHILTGDFRDDYEKLVGKGWKACYAFFKSKRKDHGNNWSTNEESR